MCPKLIILPQVKLVVQRKIKTNKGNQQIVKQEINKL